MPLTPADYINARLLLGVRDGLLTFQPGKPITVVLNDCLNALDETGISTAQTILAQFIAIQFQAGELRGEVISSPYRERALLRQQLITLLNFDPGDYRQPPEMERSS